MNLNCGSTERGVYLPRYRRRVKLYYVYILSSARRTLYIGITSNFEKRLIDHRYRVHPRSFTARYNTMSLVYFEEFTRVVDAIAREKQIKGWRRSKKLALIRRLNPEWLDLAPRPID